MRAIPGSPLVTPADEFAFEGNHHGVKVRLEGEVESHLDPEVPSSLSSWNPPEAFASTPFPRPFLLARPYGSRFVPVYLRPGCKAKGLEDPFRLVEVSRGALQVQGRVVRKCLVSDQPSSGKGEPFHFVLKVCQHVAQDVGGENEKIRSQGASLSD